MMMHIQNKQIKHDTLSCAFEPLRVQLDESPDQTGCYCRRPVDCCGRLRTSEC